MTVNKYNLTHAADGTADTCYSPLSSEELLQACAKIKHVALDMDGTIYLGSKLFPYTLDFLSLLDSIGVGYSFLTNNPTKSINDYLHKLQGMGIETDAERMYTSAVATIEYIKAELPEARRLYVLGTPSMTAEFEAAGFEMTGTDPDDRPDALVVAFDTTLVYDRLCHASWLASEGIPYIATNPDRVCPTDLRTILVDCGSICQCIAHATGRMPDIVIGKPNPDMLTGIRRRYGLKPEEIAMCGDRIYTDVATAVNAGSFGILVLSGETLLDTALTAEEPPVLTIDNVGALGRLLKAARQA